MIKAYDPAGLPIGSYTVIYYKVAKGAVTRDAGFDSNVPASYVDKLTVKRGGVAVASCMSSPGGVALYGSAADQVAFSGSCWAGA